MTVAAPKTIEEAEAWFKCNAVEVLPNDFGGDIDGGQGVYAGTLLRRKFGSDFSPEIVEGLNKSRPGIWTLKSGS